MAFLIEVQRKGQKGRLRFKSGGVEVDTECWWDPAVKVDAGSYTGYATRMANKSDGWDRGKRQGIWLGPKVPVNGGSRKAEGIFIHKGLNASWSDGCIVISEAEVKKLWNAISPKDAPNVTVKITDEP